MAIYRFTFEMDVDGPPDPPDPPEPIEMVCEELGRTTRAYVSGYDRTRVHEVRLVRGEKRCLVANFNGAIPPARTIASATWRVNQNQGAVLSNARIFEGNRSTAVDLLAGWTGYGLVKVEATLDNGEVYNQVFRVLVQQSPWFTGEPYPVSGPQTITVAA